MAASTLGSSRAWIELIPPSSEPISLLLHKAKLTLQTPSKGSWNYALTFLSLLCNTTFSAPLDQNPLQTSMRQGMTAGLDPSLLHEDVQAHTAAGSLAFNVRAVFQKPRVEVVRMVRHSDEPDDVGDWEVEMVSAVVEALDREKNNEEVGVFRLQSPSSPHVRKHHEKSQKRRRPTSKLSERQH